MAKGVDETKPSLKLRKTMDHSVTESRENAIKAGLAYQNSTTPDMKLAQAHSM
jgi:hypothetical protein